MLIGISVKKIFKNSPDTMQLRKAFSYLKNWFYIKNSKLEKIHLPLSKPESLVKRIEKKELTNARSGNSVGG